MEKWFSEKIDVLQLAFESGNAIVLIFSFLFIWFLPAIISIFLNRRHFKKIFLACIPAGFSFIAWFGLVGWAVSGKVLEKYKQKANSSKD